MTRPPPLPSAAKLYEVCEATWPPAQIIKRGAWTIRDGRGGGQRVSAATENWPTTEADLPVAEAAMRALNQNPIFMVRDGQEHLDLMLQQHGYEIHDPVNLYVIPIAEMTRKKPPPVSAFTAWPPLKIMTEIWHAGGIGPGRLDVMHRAPQPKTGLLGRSNDQPAGTGFVAVHDGIAMAHAFEVSPKIRRQGTARNMLRAAAHWAEGHDATMLSLIVTQGNHAANPLYVSLGMRLVGHYHYRRKPLTQG